MVENIMAVPLPPPPPRPRPRQVDAARQRHGTRWSTYSAMTLQQICASRSVSRSLADEFRHERSLWVKSSGAAGQAGCTAAGTQHRVSTTSNTFAPRIISQARGSGVGTNARLPPTQRQCCKLARLVPHCSLAERVANCSWIGSPAGSDHER